VAALAAAARGGRVLELGVGTGGLAIPLAAQGVGVDGIEGSARMVALLRSRPGGGAVGVFQADLAGFSLPRRDYAVAVCAVSTLFMLPWREAQARCVSAAAAHLRPAGLLFVEAFRPDPSRFDGQGRREEHRPAEGGVTHRVVSTHDGERRAIRITHVLDDCEYDVTLTTRPRTSSMPWRRPLACVSCTAGTTGADPRLPPGPGTR